MINKKIKETNVDEADLHSLAMHNGTKGFRRGLGVNEVSIVIIAVNVYFLVLKRESTTSSSVDFLVLKSWLVVTFEGV